MKKIFIILLSLTLLASCSLKNNNAKQSNNNKQTKFWHIQSGQVWWWGWVNF